MFKNFSKRTNLLKPAPRIMEKNTQGPPLKSPFMPSS